MAELTFKSPGVSTREIDLSGPANVTPQGVPAGVIGTAQKGRAFVPITLARYQDFVAEFGATDGEKFGPLAMFEWFRNAQAGTYVRVLGAGDGLKRTTSGDNQGKVNYAGFVVGTEQVQADGLLGPNPYAGDTSTNPGAPGRTYFLGAFMSESNGSTLFSDVGIQTSLSASAIVRGVVMVPSGVVLGLSSSFATNNAVVSTLAAYDTFGVGANAGASLGTVNVTNGRADFVMLLNGHKPTGEFPNVITASFDPNSAQYFGRSLNTDPTKLEQAGHYLYANWDVYPAFAVVTSSGVQTEGSELGAGLVEAAFALTGSQAHNAGSSTTPNYEGFEDRFRTAFSPWVTSQKFGGKVKNLFRLHALDDGASANDLFKVTIENIAATRNENSPYGTFDLLVRDFYDTDEEPVVLEAFRGLSLDPSSDRFISRIIGDRHVFYDFDQKVGAQKLRIEGSYANVSKYVRVEVDPNVESLSIDASALPTGFRGPHFLLTAGTPSGGVPLLTGHIEGAGTHDVSFSDLASAQVAPIPFRPSVAKGTGLSKKATAALNWGVQFEIQDKLTDPNGTAGPDTSRSSYTRYFPRFSTAWRKAHIGDTVGTPADGTVVLDSDAFQRSAFSLENVQVAVDTVTDLPLAKYWDAAVYRRDGVALGTLTAADGSTYTGAATRFLDPNKDFAHLPTRKWLKFSFFVQGGFDGVNLFDAEKAELTDVAVRREFGEAAQGAEFGPTVRAYRKAIDVMAEKADVDIQLLAIPGLRHSSITDYAIEAVESRFDALLLMDVEEMDQYNEFITGSSQLPSVSYTADRVADRNLDTSFAAAYYPDVVVQDPTTLTNVVVPPTVAVLGAFALNDTVAYPWFAPAGFTRGALARVQETQVKLNRTNLDDLYEVDVNPLTSFADSNGVVVFGQKTMLAAQSALDRVNVRRLLIELRRRVRRIANTFIFEPNREETLSRFSAAVNPVLQQIQAQRGVSRFKVQIDTTTTTQADVENNTIRGKIYVQPTRSLEFVSLDFVVTNQGAVV
jgi:phage tail sheath protein FI